MHIPNLEDIKPSHVLKAAGMAFLAIIIVVFAVRLAGSSFSTITKGSSASKVAPAMGGSAAYDMAYGGEGAVMEEMMLSTRNVTSSDIMPIPPDGDTIPGDDAEEYEVKSYDVSIESRDKDEACGVFKNLKKLDYVIFENANEHDNGCYFTFKVKNDHVAEVLAVIDEMDPREFSENTYTIKQIVEDYTSQVEILETKLASIEQTLQDAVAAYDDITEIATNTRDAEALAKIIDSKIGIIERLTQQKININAQLERLARSKADQLDRLVYTRFSVSIAENKYIDPDGIKDSWKYAVKKFVRDINEAIQQASLNLVAVLFSAVQYVIYFFVLLYAAKYGYRVIRKTWK